MQSTLLCSRCGYPRTASACVVCANPNATVRVPPRAHGVLAEIAAGLLAAPRGFALLAATPGAARLLAWPFALALLALGVSGAAVFQRLNAALSGAREQPLEFGAGRMPDWLERAAHFVLASGFATAAQVVVGLLMLALLAWTLFPLIFELCAGPFLDELHARVEREWFGHDPRAALEPRAHGVRGALERVRLEARVVRSSLYCALLVGAAWISFAPLLWIPVAGALLFALAMGCAASLALLDLPLGRRDWPVRRRFAFMRRHLLALTAFGAVCGLGFSVPLIGPLVVLPSASLGGLWLLMKLEN